MMQYRVVRQENGAWAVMHDGSVIKGGMNNAQAWKEADKLNGEAVSRQEDTSAWVFKKQASGE